MNIKVKKIRQLIREALRSDSEDSTTHPEDTFISNMESLIRIVFDIALTLDTFTFNQASFYGQAERAVIESPEYSLFQGVTIRGIPVVEYIISSVESLLIMRDYFEIENEDTECIQDVNEDELEGAQGNRVIGVYRLIDTPSDRFFKERAEEIIDMMVNDEIQDDPPEYA